MYWSCVVALLAVNYTWAYIQWDLNPELWGDDDVLRHRNMLEFLGKLIIKYICI